MSKLIPAIALASALAFIPSFAFAEISIEDTLDVDSTFSLDNSLIDDSLALDDSIAQRGGCHGGCRPPAPGPRPGYAPPPPPRPRPQVRYHHTTTVVRSRPVIVVEQPSTVVVSEPSEETVVESSSRRGSVLGFGIRGVGLYQGPTELDYGDCVRHEINGGAGYYVKFRPVRYISLEFINDIIFGSNESDDGSYIKVPVSLGLRGHVFDYGSFDLYAVAAASVTFVSLSDGYDSRYWDPNYDDTHFACFGGQLGAGVSFITSGCEIGLDARYTIDQAVENNAEVNHGILFSLNLGFAL